MSDNTEATTQAQTDRPGITLTREQLEAWVGHPLSDDQVDELDLAIANSSIPDAIAEVAFAALDIEQDDDEAPSHGKTLADLRDAAIEALPEKTRLIDADRDDKLTEEQIACVVADDFEGLTESIADWEMEARHLGVAYYLDDAVKAVRRDWEQEDPDADFDELFDEFEVSEERDALRDAIENRDDSNIIKDLAHASGSVLLRVAVISEDDAFSFEEVTAEQVLEKVSLQATPENIRVITDALAECSPEHSVLMGYWVFGADVGDMFDMPEGGEVQVTNPYLYLGNPFMGSGWITEEPLQGTVRIPRGDLKTDKAAFGYSLDNVYGGLSASSFEAEISHIPAPVEKGDDDNSEEVTTTQD